MHRDDDRIDDLYQGNASAAFPEKTTQSKAVKPPGYTFYVFVVLVLAGVLAVNALGQTHVARAVCTVAGSICLFTLIAIAIVSERRIGRFARASLILTGVSAYVALVAGIATLHRG